ncbi:hypothetical protein EDC18_11027 [Natranaerovirga pectinivora]|uniref:Uncharacterized protein n=1 Tax=Natranaerovirga pectinivora TaxID=682400 RepID=A0A4R3MGP4_9FIRM|nr:hypothetical protein [Natranaerovirga pectinivora]TCT12953.1 hypothetical protein EDC18_11027 [Natranaerovirga pectinivora]
MKKNKIISVIVLLMIFFLMSSLMVSGEEVQLDVNISYGFDEYIKINESMPVIVEITNLGAAFEGEVYVEVLEKRGGIIGFGKSIHIAPNETIEFGLPINVDVVVATFDVIIKDQNGVTVKKMVIDIDQSKILTSELLVGVLNNDENALAYFEKADVNTPIVMASVPESNGIVYYDALDVLIINDYDTTSFNEEQLSEIRLWVFEGGHLIVGGKNEYHIFTAFEGLVDIDVQSTTTIETNFNNSNLMTTNLEIDNIKIEDSKDVFGDGTVLKSNVFSGVIITAPFDLAFDSEYESKEDFATLLLNKIITSEYISELINRDQDTLLIYNDFFDGFPEKNTSNKMLNIFIGIIYLIVSVILIIYVGKKLNKGKLAAIAIIGLGVITILGVNLLSKQVTIDRINIINLDKNKQAGIQSYMKISLSKGNDLDIQEKNDMTLQVLNGNGNDTHSDAIYFGMADTEDFKEKIYWDLTYSEEGITGNIYNHLGKKMEDVFIYGKGRLVSLGDIKEGRQAVSGYLNPSFYGNNIIDILFSDDNKEDIEKEQRIALIEMFLIDDYIDANSHYNLVGFYNLQEESNVQVNSKSVKENSLNMVIVPLDIRLLQGVEQVFPLGYFTPILAFVDNRKDYEYDISNGIFYGEKVELGYIFNNIDISQIRFDTIENHRFDQFSGEIFIYNNEQEAYEAFDYKNEVLEGEQLTQVLDEHNQLLIKLIQENNQEDNPVAIPLIGLEGIYK